MTSLLRQIVAGPRAKHAETGLDLCYVTSDIIVTSGPSQTYPQRAYRNPLDRLVAFLDTTHGDGWAIWEFRGEGTGYPDEAVHGRIRHYPWPDHHPPPFRLVPLVTASMRNWLDGGDLDGVAAAVTNRNSQEDDGGNSAKKKELDTQKKANRVVVVHCKAGKGRSGTMTCSFLIAERGWTAEAALARFTERRMRPKFGAGVSIPSQLRWVSYVDRWAKSAPQHDKTRRILVDKPVEVREVHVWGLRNGVKMAVEGFVEDGKKIRAFHIFRREERIVVESDGSGGRAVIFKPAEPVRLHTSDIKLSFQRSKRAPANMGLTMVTAVAHVWFNAFFEGRGPEQDGKADESGVFEIPWEQMDGLKGSNRRGTKACDRVAVVWRFREEDEAEDALKVVSEPGPGSPVPQMEAANWRGGNDEDPNGRQTLGLQLRQEKKDVDMTVSATSRLGSGKEDGAAAGAAGDKNEASVKGMKISGPSGDDVMKAIGESSGAV